MGREGALTRRVSCGPTLKRPQAVSTSSRHWMSEMMGNPQQKASCLPRHVFSGGFRVSDSASIRAHIQPLVSRSLLVRAVAGHPWSAARLQLQPSKRIEQGPARHWTQDFRSGLEAKEEEHTKGDCCFAASALPNGRPMSSPSAATTETKKLQSSTLQRLKFTPSCRVAKEGHETVCAALQREHRRVCTCTVTS